MTQLRADEPHPDARAVLEAYHSTSVPPFDEISPAEARTMMDTMYSSEEPSIELESVSERSIDGARGEVPVRIYDSGQNTAGSRPIILYFHGGGWVVGSLDTHDETCRKLAAESGYPVVSVGYRLAPEHPFPEGLTDCYRALEWLAGAAPELGADPDRIVLAGDSAGGNLAAATALLARDRDGPSVAYQLLLYPVTGDASETDAYEENADGYLLTADEMEWFLSHYLARDVDEGNVYALPRRAADLTGLPPATVLTAGFDPLRDDGVAYADRLQDAGVPVTLRNYDDLIHGFVGMLSEPMEIERAHDAVDDVVDDLRTALE
ncbi:alpha/beta hydrolase [Natrarchaeobius halalkaliphilus]|uniref:Alpha/beta hydrolase n=1 Tax=Natrarchaeobius halalkaliphilus TaxID=1679091 RepID=A0A3N6P4L6_9EURY|nr:alpha/beta hydrolase [Natrarchaeobius halalkaliphilus]RQG92909.1 alpha/beta hydrolase [Natrarchaeobius halalkaliphilus]